MQVCGGAVTALLADHVPKSPRIAVTSKLPCRSRSSRAPRCNRWCPLAGRPYRRRCSPGSQGRARFVLRSTRSSTHSVGPRRRWSHGEGVLVRRYLAIPQIVSRIIRLVRGGKGTREDRAERVPRQRTTRFMLGVADPCHLRERVTGFFVWNYSVSGDCVVPHHFRSCSNRHIRN